MAGGQSGQLPTQVFAELEGATGAPHYYLLGFPAGPFRPGRSREGPGTGRDRTGPRDLEGPVVPWSRD